MGRRATFFTFLGGEMHPTGLPEPLGPFLAPQRAIFCFAPLAPLLGGSPSGQVTLVQISTQPPPELLTE